jgi:disulfide oxidoreductase YuzD
VETTRITEYYLRMKYGDAIRVEYIDLTEAESQEKYAGVMELVEQQNLAYPLVAVDGRLRMAGSAHYYRILPFVEEVLQPELVT